MKTYEEFVNEIKIVKSNEDFLSESLKDINGHIIKEIVDFLEKQKQKFKILKDYIKLIDHDFDKNFDEYFKSINFMYKYDSSKDSFVIYPRIEQKFKVSPFQYNRIRSKY